MLAHALALLTLAATAALIVFGGLVTNTGAALAVPDWPTTFGHNMFLFPWSGMVGGVFYEHAHRLLGSVVGLLTIALAAVLWRSPGRLRWLGVAALVGVVAQGVLGGLRVVLLQSALAVVHGCLAQAFLALVAVIAYLTSRAASAPSGEPSPGLGRLTLAAAGVTYLQVVTGALLTHAGRLDAHLGIALAVYGVVPVATARLRRRGDRVGGRLARWLLAMLGLQLLLGIGTLLARFTSVALPAQAVTGLALPVAHRLTGGLILALTAVLATRANLGPVSRRAAPGAVPAPVGGGAR